MHISRRTLFRGLSAIKAVESPCAPLHFVHYALFTNCNFVHLPPLAFRGRVSNLVPNTMSTDDVFSKSPASTDPTEGFSPAQQAAAELRVAAQERGAELKQAAAEKTAAIQETATDKIRAIKDTAADQAIQLRDAASERLIEGKVRAQELHTSFEDYVRANPTRSVLTAVGVGFIIGLISRR